MKKKWILAVCAMALAMQAQVFAGDIEIDMENGDVLVDEMDAGEIDVDIEEDPEDETDEMEPVQNTVIVKESTVDPENFQETVLYEDDFCVLKLTGLDPENEWGYAWNIAFENKTDKEVMFFFDSASVNDYMVGVMKDVDDNVPAGGSVEDRLIFSSESLDENQIDEFARAEFTIYISSSDDYFTLAQDIVSVTFAGVEETQADGEDAQAADGEVVLAQTDDYLVKIRETETNEDGYFWKIYLENYSDRSMQVYLENMTINGLVCDPYWSASVSAGKKLNDTVSWYAYMMEENGISDVTQIEGNVYVMTYSEDLGDYEEGNYPVQLYPLGEDAVKPYERTPVEGEYTVLDNDSCKVIVTGQSADDYGYYLDVYLENKSDQDFEIVMDSSVLNGVELENAWGVLVEDVPAGKACNTQAYWGSEDLEQIGITDAGMIGAVDVVLHLYDYESNEEIAREQISLVGAE